MNKCDPFYCEGLTRGHIFGVALFRVFWVRWVEVEVGVVGLVKLV